MDQYYQLSKRYGPSVRVGPNTVITFIRKMSAVQSPCRRSMNYYAMRLNPGKDHLFSTRNEVAHNDLRKTMTAHYSGKENLSLENDVDESILELCHLIDNKYSSTAGNIKPMHLARKISFMVLDIISKVAFDAKFYDLTDDRDNHGHIAEIENLLPSITWIAPVAGLVKFLTDIGLLQMAARFAGGRAGVEKKRFQPDGRPKDEMRSDMLGSFIRHGLSHERAKEEAILNLTAGSDTTASTIRATMLNIMASPRLYRLLTAEIDDAVARGALPPEGKIVSANQAHELLPLLQATIKEGLRWYPAVAAELSKLTPPQGDTICGYYVPGGTKVGTSMKVLYRNEELYGPDAEAFRPERWLLSSESRSPGTLEPFWDTRTSAMTLNAKGCLAFPPRTCSTHEWFFDIARQCSDDTYIHSSISTTDRPHTSNISGLPSSNPLKSVDSDFFFLFQKTWYLKPLRPRSPQPA
ncbi:uncharacterized protein MYCFIDRAFT_41391 [Pseudocercospora fijiensis CIRAD86]|uniref:Cytochrome P450 monooxygenase n=1 Tax=Pseudocercospora fijiensis (strain CIRAD86) TaxID=383855 RepID=M2Z532_PSEFD|nr:uncharacterized protein MYCFIDRAFT_41391 [Pseudocercospora fijiensis CIRAD86]EME84920.1 hypothetical protein MYCFIDRAFT_41391 [Pseudocercospora fijiensis CIRAD86]